MLERTIDLEIERTYSELRTILLKRDCKIVSEEPPKHISIKHGSLRGITPKSAKKVVRFHTFPNESRTKIVSYSTISADWANLTLWGSIIASFLAAVFWWIASDIATFLVDGKSGYWTWLVEAFGYPNASYTFFMIAVIRALSIVLIITILLEILDVFIVYRKIDTFAQESFDVLVQKQILATKQIKNYSQD